MSPEEMKELKAKVDAKKAENAKVETQTKEEADLIAEAKALGIDIPEIKKPVIVAKTEEEKSKIEKKDGENSITPDDLKSIGVEIVKAIKETSSAEEKPETPTTIYG